MSKSEIERLQNENRQLKTRLKNHDAARRYSRLVEAGVASGLPRCQAVAAAGRKDPQGRESYLLLTNRAITAPTIKNACRPKRRVVNR